MVRAEGSFSSATKSLGVALLVLLGLPDWAVAGPAALAKPATVGADSEDVRTTQRGGDTTYEFKTKDTVDGSSCAADTIRGAPPHQAIPLPCWDAYTKVLEDPQKPLYLVKSAFRTAMKCFDPCLERAYADNDSRFLAECMDWSDVEALRRCEAEDSCDKLDYFTLFQTIGKKAGCSQEQMERAAMKGDFEGWHRDPKSGECVREFNKNELKIKYWARQLHQRFVNNKFKCPENLTDVDSLKWVLDYYAKTGKPFKPTVRPFVVGAGKKKAGVACGYNEMQGYWYSERFVCRDELYCELSLNQFGYHSPGCMRLVRKKASELEFRQTGRNCLGDRPWREAPGVRNGGDLGVVPLGEGVFLQYSRGDGGLYRYYGLVFER